MALQTGQKMRDSAFDGFGAIAVRITAGASSARTIGPHCYSSVQRYAGGMSGSLSPTFFFPELSCWICRDCSDLDYDLSVDSPCDKPSRTSQDKMYLDACECAVDHEEQPMRGWYSPILFVST